MSSASLDDSDYPSPSNDNNSMSDYEPPSGNSHSHTLAHPSGAWKGHTNITASAMRTTNRKGWGKMDSFIFKLFRLLNRTDLEVDASDMIRWSESGKFIIIRDEGRFVEKVGQIVFNQRHLTSFNKQMNNWGFRRGKRSPTSGASKDASASAIAQGKAHDRREFGEELAQDDRVWFHPYLSRASTTEDLLSVKRHPDGTGKKGFQGPGRRRKRSATVDSEEVDELDPDLEEVKTEEGSGNAKRRRANYSSEDDLEYHEEEDIERDFIAPATNPTTSKFHSVPTPNLAPTSTRVTVQPPGDRPDPLFRPSNTQRGLPTFPANVQRGHGFIKFQINPSSSSSSNSTSSLPPPLPLPSAIPAPPLHKRSRTSTISSATPQQLLTPKSPYDLSYPSPHPSHQNTQLSPPSRYLPRVPMSLPSLGRVPIHPRAHLTPPSFGFEFQPQSNLFFHAPPTTPANHYGPAYPSYPPNYYAPPQIRHPQPQHDLTNYYAPPPPPLPPGSVYHLHSTARPTHHAPPYIPPPISNYHNSMASAESRMGNSHEEREKRERERYAHQGESRGAGRVWIGSGIERGREDAYVAEGKRLRVGEGERTRERQVTAKVEGVDLSGGVQGGAVLEGNRFQQSSLREEAQRKSDRALLLLPSPPPPTLPAHPEARRSSSCIAPTSYSTRPPATALPASTVAVSLSIELLSPANAAQLSSNPSTHSTITPMAPLILTMVRHGESVDNLSAKWAGRRDASLTHYGFQQSMRLAKEFEDVEITAIYASDLKRAHTTAHNIWTHNKASKDIPFVVSPLLQEQYFGEAEGEPWDAGIYHSLNLPWEDLRDFRLAPSAESLTDVQTRASAAVRHFLLPHLIASSLDPSSKPHHVLLVAHGIFLSEMNFALIRADHLNGRGIKYLKKGSYTNTGWSRWELTLDPSSLSDISPHLLKDDGPIEVQVDEKYKVTLPHPRHEALPPALAVGVQMPSVRHKVLEFNNVKHLVGLERQGGGIGREAHDKGQRKLEEFFGGGGGGGAEKERI